jgi:hypothetical protein
MELFGQTFAGADKLCACSVFLVEDSTEGEDLVLIDGCGEIVDAREFEPKPCTEELVPAHAAIAKEAAGRGDDGTSVGFFDH